jgi:hypothetical protein
MVSCDANATDASMDVDIFTLARDKGAVAAVCLLELADISLAHDMPFLH